MNSSAPNESPKRSRIVRLSMRTRRSISGYLFIMPFIIGFLFFMVSPLFMSLQMSFSAVNGSTVATDEMIQSYLGYGDEVKLSREIELPENLRFDQEKLNKEDPDEREYIVERVDEVITLRSDFAYGHTVPLSRKIALPSYVWYNPYDLKEGKYNVEPLKTFMDLGTSFSLGNMVTLSEKVRLPDGFQYNKQLEKSGVYAVELADSVLTLPKDFTFGENVVVSKAIVLPEGYSYLPSEEAAWLLAKNAGYTFGKSVYMDSQIELPQGYRYLSSEEAAWALAQRTNFSFGPYQVLDSTIELPEGYTRLSADASAWRLAQLNGFAFGNSIVLSGAIELPEGYHVLSEEETAWILAQKAGFTFGENVIIDEEIELPAGYSYVEADALTEEQKAAGLWVIVPDNVKTIPLSFGSYLLRNGYSALLAGLIEERLPENTDGFITIMADDSKDIPLSFGEYMLENGYGSLLAEVVADFVPEELKGVSIVVADNSKTIPISFGDHLLKNGYGSLLSDLVADSIPEDKKNTAIVVADNGGEIPLAFGEYMLENGYGSLLATILTNASAIPDAQKNYAIITADDGSDIPLSFAVYMFENGFTAELKTAVETVKPDTTVRFIKASAYDKGLYEAEGQFVVKNAVGADFAAYLIDEGHLSLFAEAVAAAQGVDVAALNLPEYFTYDHELFQSKKSLAVQVTDDEANVPTKFAVHLLCPEYGDLFYQSIDVIADSTKVCTLYSPEYDGQKQLIAIGVQLPTDITCDVARFEKDGVIDVKLYRPQIPFSFAGTLWSNGLFWETLTDLVGLDNFVHSLTVNHQYPQYLLDEISRMALHTVAILVVSFVIALLLNQEFKGRAFVRAIFFLPVILSSGVLVNLEADNSLMQSVQELISDQTPFTVTDSMMEILRLTGLGGDLLDVVFNLIAEVYDIVMASGIQIVVFLSGLQNVPASLYEAADVEGCTKWESFWKITFPMVSPLLIVNLIYTIIDFFSKMGGDLSDLLDRMMVEIKYDYMSAMSWIYFLVTLALIGVSALIVSKVVASDE